MASKKPPDEIIIRDRRARHQFSTHNLVVDHWLPIIGPIGLGIYSFYVRCADKDDESSFPSLDLVRQHVDIGRSTVIYYNYWLEQCGLIYIDRGTGGGHNVYYILDVPRATPARLADLRTWLQSETNSPVPASFRRALLNRLDKYKRLEQRWEEKRAARGTPAKVTRAGEQTANAMPERTATSRQIPAARDGTTVAPDGTTVVPPGTTVESTGATVVPEQSILTIPMNNPNQQQQDLEATEAASELVVVAAAADDDSTNSPDPALCAQSPEEQKQSLEQLLDFGIFRKVALSLADRAPEYVRAVIAYVHGLSGKTRSQRTGLVVTMLRDWDIPRGWTPSRDSEGDGDDSEGDGDDGGAEAGEPVLSSPTADTIHDAVVRDLGRLGGSVQNREHEYARQVVRRWEKSGLTAKQGLHLVAEAYQDTTRQWLPGEARERHFIALMEAAFSASAADTAETHADSPADPPAGPGPVPPDSTAAGPASDWDQLRARLREALAENEALGWVPAVLKGGLPSIRDGEVLVALPYPLLQEKLNVALDAGLAQILEPLVEETYGVPQVRFVVARGDRDAGGEKPPRETSSYPALPQAGPEYAGAAQAQRD